MPKRQNGGGAVDDHDLVDNFAAMYESTKSQ